MRNRKIVHDRLAIYNGFTDEHQECWVHLTRRFLKLAIKGGMYSVEYDRYVVITTLYRRAKKLAERIAARVGIPNDAAGMADCRRRVQELWSEFKSEYDAIERGLYAVLDDLNGQPPATYLRNMMPRILTALRCPGMPLQNNPSEQCIHRRVIRPRHVFGALPNWVAARNFSTIQTFAATCHKRGLSPYHAVMVMQRDPGGGLFSIGVPPPIFPQAA